MNTIFPFLTSYDPPGTSEGTLDPLGLYQIADQLAMQLVPAVRERMQRIRFLTAMAVGALVTEGLDDDPQKRDASPCIVWEWLVVEALIRSMGDDSSVWGVPGTLVARRALDQHGYLDARSYLKTPRIFGFNGVYKRLAIHLGILDVHMGPGPNAEALVDAWARGLGFTGLAGARSRISSWSAAVERSLGEKPPRTKPSWGNSGWDELAQAFAPSGAKGREKRYLCDLLLAESDRRLGALPAIWELQEGFGYNEFNEELLHERLKQKEPKYGQLLEAIKAYETFSRNMQDAFDVLRAVAGSSKEQGFSIPQIADDKDFRQSVQNLYKKFASAHRALGEVNTPNVSLQNTFSQRFETFAEPMDAGICALMLCTHHETIQRAKSTEGKRPWFDRLGNNRIYIRHAYRVPRREILPGLYLHEYRGWPIRRFRGDLRGDLL